MTIDGSTDSFKTITIQAYQNNLTIYNWYNNLSLKISKNHGWLQTLDMFHFPNVPIMSTQVGTLSDSTQHIRLPRSFNITNLDSTGNSKYAPGNEWIFWQTWGIQDGANKLVTHDSIISVQPSSVGTATVIYHRDLYRRLVSYSPSGIVYSDTSYSYTGIMTINTLLTIKPVTDAIRPEARRGVLGEYINSLDSITFRYLIDTGCNGQYIIKCRTSAQGVITQQIAGCYDTYSSVSGFTISGSDYLTNFGYTNFWGMSNDGSPTNFTSFSSNYYSYIKTGSCNYGTKISVSSLGIKETSNKYPFSFFPNPATNAITINSNVGSCNISITDITGKNYYRQELTNKSINISVQDFPAGIYIVHLVTDAGNATSQKLVIMK